MLTNVCVDVFQKIAKIECDMPVNQWLSYIEQMIPVAVRYNSVPTKSSKRTCSKYDYMQQCISLIILSFLGVMDKCGTREEH